jgi:hypothetical protein
LAEIAGKSLVNHAAGGDSTWVHILLEFPTFSQFLDVQVPGNVQKSPDPQKVEAVPHQPRETQGRIAIAKLAERNLKQRAV